MTNTNQQRQLEQLLDEVRNCFTSDDDLPNGLLTRIDDALDAPQPAKPEPTDAWQPIDTAPTHGTFLVYTPNETESRQVQTMTVRGNFSTIGSMFDFDCKKPTHWQPRPALPAAI